MRYVRGLATTVALISMTGCLKGSELAVEVTDADAFGSSASSTTTTASTPSALVINGGSSFSFGSLVVGGSTSSLVTVANSGSFSATGISPNSLTAPWSFTGGSFPGSLGTCTTSLAATASCQLDVTFSPASTGYATGLIQLSYSSNGASGLSNLTMTGNATAVPTAVLAISDSPSYDFGTLFTGTSATRSFTVSNSGSGAAGSISASGLSTPLSFFSSGTFPGTGGTCGATLASGASCTFVVAYQPSVSGSSSQTISISYNDGSVTQSVTRAVSGTAVQPAALTISGVGTHNYGSLAVGGSSSQSFTISNGGGTTATSMGITGLSAPFAFAGGSYPGTSGTCGTTLAAAGTCTINVTFAPTSAGTASATMTLGYHNGNASTSTTKSLTGTGVNLASLSISDGTTYSFGTRATGSTTDHTFTITNSGAGTASGLAISESSAQYSIPSSTCSTSLAAASTCTVTVRYSPSAAGTDNVTLTATYNDGINSGQSATRAITGTAISPALLTISGGSTYDFGSVAVGGSADATFTVSNTGGSSASITSNAGGLAAPYAFKGGTYPGTSGTCGSTLAAAGNCTVVVSFSPTASGTTSDTLELTYNDGLTSTTASRPVTGTGLSPASLSISEGSIYDFGTVATSSSGSHSFTLSNSGGSPATSITGSGLAAPFSFNSAAFPGGGTCGSSLNSGSTCTFTVTFSPTSGGAQSDTIVIDYNDGAASSSASRAVTGTGSTGPAPALLTISDGPGTYDFGTVGIGQAVSHFFYVANSGGQAATGIAASALTGAFQFKYGSYPGFGGTCGTTLAAGATCSISVEFMTGGAGSFSQTLNVTYYNGTTSPTASRGLTGTGTSGPSLVITDFPPHYYSDYGVPADGLAYSYGEIATATNQGHTFHVKNIGGSSANSMSASFGGPNPGAFNMLTGYPGTGGTCMAVLAPGEVCTIVVQANVGGAGVFNANLNLSYSSTSATRAMTATGSSGAILTIYDHGTESGGLNIGPTYDYGVIGVGQYGVHAFAIVNTGSETATSLSATSMGSGFEFVNYAFPGGTPGTRDENSKLNYCGTSLAPGAACAISVRFGPYNDINYTAQISIAYMSSSTPKSALRDIKGLGTYNALLQVSSLEGGGDDSAITNFGYAPPNVSRTKMFRIKNIGGNIATTINASTLSTPFSYFSLPFPGGSGTYTDYNQNSYPYCTPSGSLSAGSECVFRVEVYGTFSGLFTASPNFSYYNGSAGVSVSKAMQIELTYNAIVSMKTCPNCGGGGDEAVPTRNLGYVANSGTRTIDLFVTNDGSSSAAIVSAPLTGNAAYTYASGGIFPGGTAGSFATNNNGQSYYFCPVVSSSIPSYTTCVVRINYSPSGSTEQSTNITVNLTGATTSNVAYNIKATPTNLAIVNLSTCSGGGCGDGDSSPISFGQAGVVIDKIVYVTNSGAQGATINPYSISGDFMYTGGSYPGGTGSQNGYFACGASLPSNDTCWISIRYTPFGTSTSNGMISLSLTGATASEATKSLSGTGTNRAMIMITDSGPSSCNQVTCSSAYNFGSISTSTTNSRTLTLWNMGGDYATSISFNSLFYPFSIFSNTCGSGLATGATCTVILEFNSASPGTFNTNLTVTVSDGGGSLPNVTRQLQASAL